MNPALNCLKLGLCVKFFVIACLVVASINAGAQTDGTEEAEEATPPASLKKAPTAQATFAADHQYHEEILANYVADRAEPVWLETPGGRFLALWQGDHNGSPLGALLVVPGLGSSPVRSALPQQLQLHLTHAGWPTLTLYPAREAPPSYPERPPAKAKAIEPSSTPESAGAESSEQDDSAPATPAEEQNNDVDESQVVAEDAVGAPEPPSEPEPPEYTPEDAQSETFARIDAAVAHLQSQGHYNISLLGHQTGAWLSLLYLQEAAATVAPAKEIQKNNQRAKITQPIRALIMLDVFAPADRSQPKDLLLSPQIPTLDIYSTPYGHAELRADERKRAANRNQYELYIQRYLPPDPPHQETGRTVRTIRGFLERNAGGVELD